MKIIMTIVLLLFGWYFSNAQNTSEVKVNSSSNTSIAVSNNNNDYSYSAKFHSEKTEKVKAIMVKELGKPTESSGKISVWEGKGYSATLKDGKAEIEVEKSKVSKSFLIKMEELGEDITEILDTPKAPKAPTPPPSPKAPRK
jgi:hypothetical protein